MTPSLKSLDATRGTSTNNPASSQGQPASDAGTFALVLGKLTAPQEPPAEGRTLKQALKQEIAPDDKAGLFGVAPMLTPIDGTAKPADTEREPDTPGEDAEAPVDTALIASALAQLQVRPVANSALDAASESAIRSSTDAVDTAVPSDAIAATSGLPVVVADTPASALQDTTQGQAAPAVNADVQRMAAKTPPTPGIDVSANQTLPESNISVNPAAGVITAPSLKEAQVSPTRSIEKKQYKQYVTEVESSAASSPAEDTSRNSVPAGVAASASVALPVAEKALTGIGIKPPVIQRAAAPQDMSATEEGDAQALEITPAVAALSMHARSFARPPAVDRAGETLGLATTTPGLIASSDNRIPTLDITPQLGSAEWKPAFNGSVQMLLNNGVTNAALQLNPAELGPVDVRIQVVDQRADISFAVANADAGAAIRSALQELREQLARGGIHLGHTSVGSNGQDAQQAPMPLPQPRARAYAQGSATLAANQPLPPVALRSSNQIDFYA